MLTTTRWRLLDRAVEFKRHLQLAANSAHYSILTLLSLHTMIIFILPISITIRWILNVKQCKNCSLSLGTCCYKTTTNYRVITKSAAENKIFKAYRPPCPPVCANWVNWPFRDQHHAATHLDLASIFFSPQNITLAILPWSHLILTWFSQKYIICKSLKT